MNILMLSTSFPRWNGDWAGSFVLALASALNKRHEVKVVAPNSPHGAAIGELRGVPIRRFDYSLPRSSQCVIYPDGIPDQLKKSHLAKAQLPLFLASFAGVAVREAHAADIIVCNWAATGMIARVATWLSRKPYVVVIRGSDMRTMEKKGTASRLYVKALKGAAAVCTVAEDFVLPLRAFGLRRVHFTPNGIDYDSFAPRPANRGAKDKKTVLFVGSLIERKGLDHLISAMSGINADLQVVGEGHLKSNMEALAKEQGVNAKFVGRVCTEDMPTYFAGADVFVLPSLYEGRPNVLMEAMACGCACIATDIKGTRELIDHGVSGLLAPAGESSGLASLIERILADDDLREALGNHARESVMRRVPSWDKCAENYEKILTDVLSNV